MFERRTLLSDSFNCVMEQLANKNVDVVINVQTLNIVNLYIELIVQVMWIFGDLLREINHVVAIIAHLEHFDLNNAYYVEMFIAIRYKYIYKEKW